MKLRTQVLLFLFLFGFAPLTAIVISALPFILDRVELFYHKAHLQNLRADFRDLDEHLASRHEMVRLLAKLPEPSLILGEELGEDDKSIDEARVRYTIWINQILGDYFDIDQILFLDAKGQPRFWLELDLQSREWKPTLHKPVMPSPALLQRAMEQSLGEVSVSKISLGQTADMTDPRHFMTLNLISAIGHRTDKDELEKIGYVVVNVDAGGMARAYMNTLWVTNDGAYLLDRVTGNTEPNAFKDFAGLEAIFATGKLGLWEGQGGHVIWVPLFMTEESGPLWVGRAVDPSPVIELRNNLLVRLVTIGFIALAVVLLTARWIASAVSRIGQSMTERIGRVLRTEEPVQFNWRGPREIRDLGQQLTELANNHARHAQEQKAHALQLEKSNQYKSEFLANVSHELRTPLNSILLLSKMLDKGGDQLNAEQKKQIRVIHEAGADLKALIDDILDLSKIEAGGAVIDPELIQLPSLLNELNELLKPQFEAKGLDFSVELESGTPEKMVSDPAKIKQILKNFLANAVKFTSRGGITLRVYQMLADSACPMRFAVKDTGIGIPADKHELIFEAFKQADGSTRREYGGTGLGLSISRELAALLEGRIELESVEGKGSTFTLCLPLAISSETHAEPQQIETLPADDLVLLSSANGAQETESTVAEAEFTGMQVLIVDDNVQHLLQLTPVLEDWGLEIVAAVDENEVFDALTDEPGIALMLIDTMVPELHGYDTIRAIRKDRRFTGLYIIALTNTQVGANSEKALEAGADIAMHKPIDSVKLKHTIGEIFTKSRFGSEVPRGHA